MSQGQYKAQVNAKCAELAAEGKMHEMLKFYYEKMLKIDPELDDLFGAGRIQAELAVRFRSRLPAEQMFQLPAMDCRIQEEADMDPWQRLVWERVQTQYDYLPWVWCATNQSGKDELGKFIHRNFPSGKVLTIKKATSISRFVNQLHSSSSRVELVVVNLGMADSQHLELAADFFEEVSNYGAASSTDMCKGASVVYCHRAVVFANAPPPENLAGRRVQVLEIPPKTSEESDDPELRVYRARLKAWADLDDVSGLRLRFVPIREYLQNRATAEVGDETAPYRETAKRSKKELEEQVEWWAAREDRRREELGTAQAAAKHYREELKRVLGESPPPPPRRHAAAQDTEETRQTTSGADGEEEQNDPFGHGFDLD